jgi:hypothetical protein
MISPLGMILAAAGKPTPSMWAVTTQSLLLLGAAAALMVLGWLVMRHNRARPATDEDASDAGFSLDDLRGLHRQGLLTDEEFARIKARMIASMNADTRQATDEDLPPGNTPSGDDQAAQS